MHIYSFYFINWGEWRCWWTDFVPEAIHNLVAIKLLVSCLLTRRIYYVHLFEHHNRFCINISNSSERVLSFKQLIDRGGCHA